MPALEIDYRGATLKVEIADPPGVSASLYINNIRRMTSEGDVPCTLLLTSTVQTDYEWHEFIEAKLTFRNDATDVMLIANNAELASETFPR